MKYFLTILITAAVFSSATYGWQQMKIEELKSGKSDAINEELQQKEKEILQLEDQINGLQAQLDAYAESEDESSQQEKDSQDEEQVAPIESISGDDDDGEAEI